MEQVALLQYNNNDVNTIVKYSPAIDTLNALLSWLDANGIGYINYIPNTKGLWCVDSGGFLRVYQIIYDAENNVYNSTLVYSLQWIATPQGFTVTVPVA